MNDSDHEWTNIETNFKPIHLWNKGAYMDAAEEFEYIRGIYIRRIYKSE